MYYDASSLSECDVKRAGDVYELRCDAGVVCYFDTRVRSTGGGPSDIVSD